MTIGFCATLISGFRTNEQPVSFFITFAKLFHFIRTIDSSHPSITCHLLYMEIIGDRLLTIESLDQILFQNVPVHLAPESLNEVRHCFQFLETFSKDKLIYGINTGFGPMAQYRIDDNDRVQLQLNLIRSHCSGMGQLLSPLQARATLVARLNTLMRAQSGIHSDLVQLMAALINAEAYPCIYRHGGVGASGDLVQLAHLALGLIGEG